MEAHIPDRPGARIDWRLLRGDFALDRARFEPHWIFDLFQNVITAAVDN